MKHKVKRISKSSLSVVLSLCMLFSCFTAAFVATDAATVDSASVGASYTVYFQNDGDWSTIKYYLFDPSDGTGWPGHDNQAGRIGTISGKKVYKLTFTANSTKIIFHNNSGTQTGDLTLENGALYNSSGKVGTFSESQLDVAKIYGSVPQSSGSWSNDEYHMTYVSPGIYSFAGLAKPASGIVHYRFNYGGYYFRYGNSDGTASNDPSNPTATVRSDAKPDAGAFTLTPEGKDYTVYIDVSDLDNVTTWYQFAYNTNVDFAIIGNLNKLATINGSAPSGVGSGWPGQGTFVTPTASGQNALKTGSDGVYSITFTTGNYDGAINIGLYQISENQQRGFYVDGTYYNSVGSDYTVPYNGISAADNCYAVDGTGSLILQKNTEYTLTIDQTQPLDSSNPYGKITITTNKKQITASAKVKKRNTSTNALGSATNANATIGTATADPTVGTTGFSSTLTAAVTDTANYTFSGWYSDESCTTSVTANTTYTVSSVSSDVTYYALFVENELPTLTYTAISGDNGTVSPASGTVLKGGSVTLTATPSTGYIIDTATSTSGTVTVATNDNNNNATITVSNITANATINVTFKRIETYALTISADASDKGKVSVTYYDANGTQTTASNITTGTTINAQKGKVVSLTATANSGSMFNGWNLTGDYQRSSSTPLSGNNIDIKPSSNMTIKGLFGQGISPEGTALNHDYYVKVASSKTGNYSTTVPLYVKYDVQDGSNYYSEFRSYFTIGDTDDPANGKLKVGEDYWFIVVHNSNDGNISNSMYNAGISLTSTVTPSGTTWNDQFKSEDQSQKYAVYVKFTSAAKTATVFWGKRLKNASWDQLDKTVDNNSKYPVDFYVTADSSGGTGDDDTPDKTGKQKLYVLDGVDSNNSLGTNLFGTSIITKAPSGVLKYDFYDAEDEAEMFYESTGHSEGGRLYYYDPNEDLSFRVQTTIKSGHQALGVRAFVMNGKTYMAKKDSDGTYYADISLPAGDHGTLEVIPVYYNTLIPDKDYIYFEVDANTLGNSWGKTIGYSLWYTDTSLHGMEGGYPGQPLMSDGNLLYGYIPKYYVAPDATSLPTASSRVKFSGVLLTNLCEHNSTHEDVMKDWGITVNDETRNYQTFDYEDPAKIASIANVDTIKFIVKFEETDKSPNQLHQSGTHFIDYYSKNNGLNNASNSTWPSGKDYPTASNLGNFEVLTDIDGKAVDIYGNGLKNDSGQDITEPDINNAVFVISVGNQIVGSNQWDTVWMIYDGDNRSFIKANNPAEFINVASTSQLSSLKNKTVYISYEKFLDGDAKQGISNSGDRIDGRWVYTKSTDATTVRLRVAKKDSSGNLIFLTTNGIDVAEITDGTVNGPYDSGDSSNLTKKLELENRTTDVTAKINVKGYKVEDFYMLSSAYAVTSANNGFSTNISDYDDLNVNGTGYTFKNTKDNRMVIVIEEIPAEDLVVFHQEYKGEGAHNITGVYYAKVEMYDAKNGNPIDMSSSVNKSKYGVFKNTLNQFTNFVNDAAKDSGRYLKITLRTTMPPSAQFYQWYENDHNGGYNLIDSTAARGSEDPVETVVWVPVAGLYGDLTDNLSIVNLDYYSDLQSGDSIDIHHNLTTDTINNGMDGSTYVQVKVMDANGNTVSGGNLGTKLNSINVDSTFITEDNADAGYQIEVNVWTIPDSPATFDKFYRDDGTNQLTSEVYNGVRYYYDGTTTATGGYLMATAVIPVDYFFKEVDNGSGTLIKVVDTDKKNFYLYSALEQSTRQIQITKTSDVTGDTTDFNFIVEYKDGSNWIAAEGTYTGTTNSGNLTSTGQGTVRAGETVTVTLSGASAAADLRVSEVTSGLTTHTPNGVTVTNATNVTAGDSSVTFTPGDSPISVVTISNKKNRTLTITKTTDENTSETFDFKVYKRTSTNPDVYTAISNSTAFTFSGSGTFTNGTLTISKNETASMTVYTDEVYKVVELPDSDSAFAFDSTATATKVTPTSGESPVSDSNNNEYGFDGITIGNDTTTVTVNNTQIKQTVYIDKVTNAEYDYVTDFKVRIQKKVGNDYVDINDALSVYKKYGTTDQDGPVALGYTNIEGGGYEYTINKGDRIVVSGVPKNTQIRIIESDYASNYYTFGSINVSGATGTETVTHSKDFTVGDSDVTVTVTNNFIPQTIKVTKKTYIKSKDQNNQDVYTDFNHNDGSEFDINVTWNPHNSGSANYIALQTGEISLTGLSAAAAPAAGSAAATNAASGIYTVQKNGYVYFTNVPKGSYIKVNESRIGKSPLTGEQRFAFDSLVNSNDSEVTLSGNGEDKYISLSGNLDLHVRNIVKQNTVTITKSTDSGDSSVDHTLTVHIWDNGKSGHTYASGGTAHTDTTEYSTINYKMNGTAYSTNNNTITIHSGESIVFTYPLGSYYTISESAGSLYHFNSVTCDTTKVATNNQTTGTVTYVDETTHETVNTGVIVPTPSVDTTTGAVSFQTKDAQASVNYINVRNDYTYTITKQTNINNTDDEFKIKVWVKDNASVQNWTQYTAAIGQHTADATTGEYIITKGAQLTITGLNANSLIKVEETDVNSPKYAIGSINAVGTDADFHYTQGETSAYTTVNADKGLVITNNVQTTTVTINKSVTGGATGKYTEFPLTVKITDESGSSSKTYAYTSSYTTSGSYTAHTGSVTNGTANSNVNIWGTETLTFTGVPVGATVEVTEGTMPTGYSCTSIGATGGANVTFNTKPNVTFKTTGSATAAVAIVNAVATHNVTITKAISNSNNSTEEFSISASIKPDGADDTAVTTWTRSIASAASASGSLSGMALKNGESIVLENVPEGAEITVSEAAETDFTCQSIVAMDGNSTVIASANASTLTFTVPSSNATVTVTNKINDKTVTIHKVTDTATTGKSFKIKAQYTPTNTNTLTDYTSDSFSAGYATLDKNGTATVTVPKDASVTITELTGSGDMPADFEFEKITDGSTTAAAQENGYTYTGTTNEDIYVHNTELHSVNLRKTTNNTTTDTFTFKVYKWDTSASPNAWVQVDGDYTITANAAATATTTKFRKDTLIKVVETPVTSGKYTYDHSGSSVTNAADTSYSRPSGENGFENIKMGTSDVNVTLNNTVNTKTVKISKTADYTETTTGAFTFNVNTQEEGVASAANCTYKYRLNGTGSELDFTDGNVTLASGQFIEIYNVPVDTVVTVQETNAGQATSTTAVISNEKASTGSYNPETKTAAFTVGTSANPEVQFTNSKTKTLTITKTTDIADTSENFYIKVEKYDTSTSQYVAFDGSYSGPENRLNGGKFTIYHGESISISVNTNEQYRVYETDIPSYYTLASVTPTGASSATAYPASGTQTGSDVTIGESNVTVAFVNNIAKHDVTITKAVSNLTTADTFPISVTLNDPTTDSAVHNEYTCTYDGTNTPWGSATITDGTAQTFTVAQDKTITIKDVPYGTTVTVNEVPAARYNCTGITVTGASDAGTLTGNTTNRTLEFTTAGAQTDVTVTNAVKTQDLTITKTVTNSGANNVNFRITVTIKPDGSTGSAQTNWVYTDNKESGTHSEARALPTTIKNGQTYVISNVPVGAYVTVSEAAFDQNSIYSFVSIATTDSTVVPTGQTINFDMPADDETVTITNSINDKEVSIYKVINGTTGSDEFPIQVTYMPSNESNFRPYTGTGFDSDGKATIEGNLLIRSDSKKLTVRVPMDAKVKVEELTAADNMPTGYTLSKITVGDDSADARTGGHPYYIYESMVDQSIVIHNDLDINGVKIRKVVTSGAPAGTVEFPITVTYKATFLSPERTVTYNLEHNEEDTLELVPGAIILNVTETPVTGYEQDGNIKMQVGSGTETDFSQFTLGVEPVLITVKNKIKTFDVKIEKEVVNESGTSIADSQNFGVSVQQGSSAATNHTFSKGNPVTLHNVPYGTVVTATESTPLPRGYEFVSYSSNNGQAITGNTTITVTNKKLNTHDVRIEKNVDVDSGTQVFAINIDPDAACTYQVYDSSGTAKTGTGTSGSLTAATNVTVSLMKGEYVIVSGLYKDEAITVNETDEGSPTYEFVKYTVIRGSTTSDISTKEYTYNVTNDETQTIVVNNKNAVTTEYNIIYNFRSYRSLYDDMIYQTGEQSFTSAELTNTVLSGDVKNMDGGTVESMRFKSMAALKSFIDRHAPYEDGFMEEITWITDKISGQDYTPDNITHTNDDLSNDGVMVNYNESGSLVTIVVNANQTTFTTANAIFKLPYDTVKDGTKDTFAPVRDGDGEVVKIDSYARAPYATTQAAIITYNGEKIVAPERVKNGSGGYDYFSYWQVSTLPTDIKLNNPSEPYTKCFSKEFNLVLYQDSIIEPVYLNTAPVTPHEEADKTGNNSKATITFMENSRTQWNDYPDSNHTKYPNDHNWDKGDRVYTDFLVSFAYNDIQLNTSSGKNYGIVIEEAGDLRNMDGWDPNVGTTNYTQSDYANKFAGSSSAEIQNFIKGSASSSGNLKRSEKSVSTLNDYNRTDFYYAMALMNQNYGKEGYGEYYEKHFKVYKAYSYLVSTSGRNVLLCSEPIYFTVYDIANISYQAPQTP